jgi:hypothetical protein
MRRIRTLFKAAAVVGLAGLLGGGAWLVWESRAPASAGSGIVLFEVEKGQSVRAVGEGLKALEPGIPWRRFCREKSTSIR